MNCLIREAFVIRMCQPVGGCWVPGSARAAPGGVGLSMPRGGTASITRLGKLRHGVAPGWQWAAADGVRGAWPGWGGSLVAAPTPGASLLPAGASAAPGAQKSSCNELLGDAPQPAQSCCDSPAAPGQQAPVGYGLNYRGLGLGRDQSLVPGCRLALGRVSRGSAPCLAEHRVQARRAVPRQRAARCPRVPALAAGPHARGPGRRLARTGALHHRRGGCPLGGGSTPILPGTPLSRGAQPCSIQPSRAAPAQRPQLSLCLSALSMSAPLARCQHLV